MNQCDPQIHYIYIERESHFPQKECTCFCRYPLNCLPDFFNSNFAMQFRIMCLWVGAVCVQAIDSADTGEGPAGVILPVLHGDEGDVDETLFYGSKVLYIL